MKLTLIENGKVRSRNEYDLILGRKEWNIGQMVVDKDQKILLLDKDRMKSIFDVLKVPVNTVTSVQELVDPKQKAALCIVMWFGRLVPMMRHLCCVPIRQMGGTSFSE